MDTKFNLYDFLAYVIPGAIVFVLFYWFCVGFLTLSVSISSVPDATSFLLVLAVSYFLGHVVQAAGAKYQKKKEEKKGWKSEQYLQDGNKHYTDAYKKKLKEYIQQTFGLDVDTAKLHQEVFYLCNALIHKKTSTDDTDTFHATCALYRSMYITIWIGLIVSGLIAVRPFISWFLQLLHINAFFASLGIQLKDFLAFNGIQSLLGIIFFFFFLWSTTWLKSRWDQYTEYYVDSVFTNFYAWYCSKHNQQPIPLQKEGQEASLVGTPQQVKSSGAPLALAEQVSPSVE